MIVGSCFLGIKICTHEPETHRYMFGLSESIREAMQHDTLKQVLMNFNVELNKLNHD